MHNILNHGHHISRFCKARNNHVHVERQLLGWSQIGKNCCPCGSLSAQEATSSSHADREKEKFSEKKKGREVGGGKNCKWCTGTLEPVSKKIIFYEQLFSLKLCVNTYTHIYYVCAKFHNIVLPHVVHKGKTNIYFFKWVTFFAFGPNFFVQFRNYIFLNKWVTMGQNAGDYF